LIKTQILLCYKLNISASAIFYGIDQPQNDLFVMLDNSQFFAVGQCWQDFLLLWNTWSLMNLSR